MKTIIAIAVMLVMFSAPALADYVGEFNGESVYANPNLSGGYNYETSGGSYGSVNPTIAGGYVANEW